MGSAFDSFAESLPSIIGLVSAIVFVGAAYFLLTLDRTRAASPSKDDTQAGLKLVLFGIMLAGVEMAATGASSLLAYILGGFKGGSIMVKSAIPPILVGAVAVAAIAKMFLPRTNYATQKQAERYFLGALGIQFGVMALAGLGGVANGLFMSAPWAHTSHALAETVVAGAVGFFAIGKFGARSGWTMPAPPMAPPAQFPPQGGGYPPQGGGYPPQGGGYPPQGGGYPPQGGGYPPQGGGFPPQGGGFPPQGGGGYQR